MSMDADFCPACGRETRERLRVEEQRIRAGWRERHRAAKAIAVVFVGVLLSLVLAGSAGVVWENAAFLLVGLLAVALLGRSAFRQSLAKATSVRMLVLGMLAGVPSFAISYLYVNALHGSGQGGGADPITIHSVVTLCIMPALMEEWLCRGVLWVASRRIASARNTILITSILFAMMHGLGGGWTLEFPHRFVAGLIFGWLRLRSGSLLPGMLAHYLHNSLALILSSH